MNLPDKPPGCEITDAADANGLTLSWPAYKAGAPEYEGAWFPAFWLCGWIVLALVELGSALRGTGSKFLHLLFAGWTLGGVYALFVRRAKPTPISPESVRLEADVLRYNPGCGPSGYRSCADLPSGKVVPVTPADGFAVSKAAVRGFALDRVNERQRLLVKVGGRPTEIGGCLTESERAWLFGVLQAWLGEAHDAPRWAHGARTNAGGEQA